MESNLLSYLAQQQPTPIITQPASKGNPPAAPTKQDPGGNLWMTGLMFGAVFIGMYFLVIRPQRRDEKRKKELLGKLGKGDRVVTASGIIGTVQTVKDDTVILNVGDGTRIEFLRTAINEVRSETKPVAKKG